MSVILVSLAIGMTVFTAHPVALAIVYAAAIWVLTLDMRAAMKGKA